MGFTVWLLVAIVVGCVGVGGVAVCKDRFDYTVDLPLALCLTAVGALAWPVALPLAGSYYIGTRVRRRVEARAVAAKEGERLLREAGL